MSSDVSTSFAIINGKQEIKIEPKMIKKKLSPAHGRINISEDSESSEDERMQNYRHVFGQVDKNKDGWISYGELKEFLDTQERTNFPEGAIKCIHRNFDRNRDNKMNFKEFYQMVNDDRFKCEFPKTTRLLRILVYPGKCGSPLVRTTTLTGVFDDKAVDFRDMIGMILITAMQICFYYTNLAYVNNAADRTNKTDPATGPSGPLKYALKFDPYKKLEIHRYISYIFVHSNEMHLYLNTGIQVLIGIPLSLEHGWRVMVLYFAGALCGSISHSVFRRTTSLVGASGAVFSFYTAHIAAVIMNWREMSHPAVRLLIFGIIVTIDGVYSTIFVNLCDVSYPCHAGGAVVGLLLGILILRNDKETKLERILWHVCCNLCGVLITVLVLLDICLPVKEVDRQCTVN